MNRNLRRRMDRQGYKYPDDSGTASTEMKHGICHGPCGRRTYLLLPSKLCQRCLRALTVLWAPDILAALKAAEGNTSNAE